MSNTEWVYPAYYQIVRQEARGWHFLIGEPFFNPKGVNYTLEALFKDYGTSEVEIAVALFRLHPDKAGYFLANLRDRQYHYCGPNIEDVKTTFLSLGIGRVDPMDTP